MTKVQWKDKLLPLEFKRLLNLYSQTDNEVKKLVTMFHGDCQKAKRKNAPIPVFTKWRPKFREDQVGLKKLLCTLKPHITECKSAHVNGVFFRCFKGLLKSDNSVIGSQWKEGRTTQTSYGRIVRMFEHSYGEGEDVKRALLFAVQWRKDQGTCERTRLPKVGGQDEEWNSASPYVDAGSCLASNFCLAPQKMPAAGQNAQVDESCGYYVLEIRPHSHSQRR